MVSNGINPTQYQELRQAFIQELPSQIHRILETLEQLRSVWNPAAAKQLFLQIQRIAKSSLALGYTRIGISAQAIENVFKEVKDLEEISNARFAELETLVSQRLAIIEQILSTEKTSAPPQFSFPEKKTSPIPSLQDNRASRLVYLFETDTKLAQEIAHQIGYFGYNVRQFYDLDAFEEGLKREQPAVIIAEIGFTNGEITGGQIILSATVPLPPEMPIIFISSRDDVVTRLQAVRSGGKAFFLKPINIGGLIEALDRLIVVEDPLPYRILIVDDDQVQAEVNAMHLRQAGMEIYIIRDYLSILQTLHEQNPDLILLDMYMPDCSGMDLALIIRQIESFVSIPIVFLSSETDREKQLEAIGLGGDDFLTKPIKPENLVASVSSRVNRYRKLRSLMLRDSLSGLFNHTTIKERCMQEVKRAIRQNTPLAYAMIDIDHFKKVNDRYGHAVGDQVIKSLSALINKQLRKTDVVGRYGGEEFAVVLPNTSGEEAELIMNELRVTFEQIHHHAEETDFTVTFSCGLAAYPDCPTFPDLAESADRAVYLAKKRGRNCVILG